MQSRTSNNSPTFTRKEPWTATYFDNLKLFSVQLACAGGSSAIAKTAVAPLERVKILLQVQAMSTTPPAERYASARDALWRIPAREGWAALWRGNGANVLRLVPDVGLKFALNDQMRLLFAPADGRPMGLDGKLAAGAATGVLKMGLFYPLELAWTRLAADTSRRGAPRTYQGLLHCLQTTARLEGVPGLYKGVTLSAAGIVPYLAVSFAVYDELKAMLPASKAARLEWWYPVAKIGIGATAAVIAQGVAYPLDTVRRRMQLSGSPGHATVYAGYWDCVRRVAVHEGFGAFYRGLAVNCVKTAPGAALQFVAYDLIKSGLLFLEHAA